MGTSAMPWDWTAEDNGLRAKGGPDAGVVVSLQTQDGGWVHNSGERWGVTVVATQGPKHQAMPYGVRFETEGYVAMINATPEDFEGRNRRPGDAGLKSTPQDTNHLLVRVRFTLDKANEAEQRLNFAVRSELHKADREASLHDRSQFRVSVEQRVSVQGGENWRGWPTHEPKGFTHLSPKAILPTPSYPQWIGYGRGTVGEYSPPYWDFPPEPEGAMFYGALDSFGSALIGGSGPVYVTQYISLNVLSSASNGDDDFIFLGMLVPNISYSFEAS